MHSLLESPCRTCDSDQLVHMPLSNFPCKCSLDHDCFLLVVTAGQRGFLSLAAVIKPAALGAPGLLAAIQHCIGDENGLVLDRASSQLAAARRERRDNLKSLRAESEKWARQIFTQKASENSQVRCTGMLLNFQLLGPETITANRWQQSWRG